MTNVGDIGGSSRGYCRRQVGVEDDVAAGVDVAGVRDWRSSKETRRGGAWVAKVKVGVSRQGPAVDGTGAVRGDDVDCPGAVSGVVVSSLIVIVSLRTPVSCQSTVDLYVETAGISHTRQLAELQGQEASTECIGNSLPQLEDLHDGQHAFCLPCSCTAVQRLNNSQSKQLLGATDEGFASPSSPWC